MDSFLRKKPDLQSGIITTIPRLRRIIPLNVEKGYLRVSYENQIGFVDINNFVSRADFANLAFAKNKGWLPISHRNGDKLVTKSGEEFHLNDILGYVTNSHRGVIVSANGNTGPQLRSRVEILNQQANIWGYSRVDGHGNVWWKKSDLLVEAEIKSPTTITTDELMKREIYSIAFENKNSVRGIVSSEGVYRTDDGLNWTLIPQFGKQNYPVNIHPNGTWFVGSYKSGNKGKSFDPFIRWDLITQAIETSYHMNPRSLRLTQIEAMPDSQVQIYVDTGISKIKLRGALHGATWNVVR